MKNQKKERGSTCVRPLHSMGLACKQKKGTPRVSGDPTDGGANKHGKGGGKNAKLLTNTSVVA